MFDFWTGEAISVANHTSRAPIDKIPLFVRQALIVPMGPYIQYAAEKSDPVEIRIYPGADGSFQFYEDEKR